MTSQTLSWRDGVLSGCRLVARRPEAALFWGLVLFANNLAAAAWRIWAVQGVDPVTGAATMALKLSAGGLILDQVTRAVVVAAMLRAEMWPERQRSAWSRLGGDELRLPALTIPFGLLTLVGAAMTVSVWMTYFSDPGPIVSRMGKMARLVAVVLVLLGARFALAAPLTVADHRMRLAKSVSLTRGRHLRLAMILVMTLVLAGLIEEAASHGQGLLAEALAAHTPRVGTQYSSVAEAVNAAFGLGALLVMICNAMVHALTLAVQVAPLGYAWRRLTGDPITDQVAVFD